MAQFPATRTNQGGRMTARGEHPMERLGRDFRSLFDRMWGGLDLAIALPPFPKVLGHWPEPRSLGQKVTERSDHHPHVNDMGTFLVHGL
jgi:hypothetical protein